MASELVTVCYVLFLVAYLPRLVSDILHDKSRFDWIVRTTLMALMVASWFIGPTIDGLEYEDAYVHLAAAKFQLASAQSDPSSFYLEVCSAGTAANCVVSSTYGTHLIGFSTLLAWLLYAGLSAENLSNAVSHVAALLTVQVVWSLLRGYSDILCSILAISLLLTASEFYVLSGSSFAEPLYTFLFVCWIGAAWPLLSAESKLRSLNLLVVAFGGLSMIAVKKEGVLVVGLTLVWAVLQSVTLQRSSGRPWPSLAVAITCIAVIGTSVFFVGIGDAALRHSADIGTFAFDLGYVSQLLPAFLGGAFQPRYFGFLWTIALVLLPIVVLRPERQTLLLLATVVGYIGLYSIHARHAAFVRGEVVHPEEMLRYVYTLAPAVALLCGNMLMQTRTYIRQKWNHAGGNSNFIAPVAIAISAGLLLCFLAVDRRRVDFYNDEERARLSPLMAIGHEANQSTVVVSENSLALFARGPIDLYLMDASIAQQPIGQTLLAEHVAGGARVIYADGHQD